MTDFSSSTVVAVPLLSHTLPLRRGRVRVGVFKATAAILITLAAISLFNKNAAAQSATLRVIFYPPWNISKLPMYMARDAGIFERNGLKITWTNPGSNEKLLAALKNGAADIAVVSANHVAQNNASGGPTMLLVGNTGYNYSAFFADSTIKSAADLKGKKIGTGEPGSTPDQLTRLALRKLGIDAGKDVTLIPFDEGRNTDRVKALLGGTVAGMMITAETMYDLEKTGEIKKLNRLTDHKQLKIYAGGGADYAISATLLKNRRDDAKRFMSAICEGIALTRKEKAKALEFVAKTGRNMDAAGIEYLYRLYTADVIPARPHLKPEGIELAIQMTSAMFPSSRNLNATELTDATLVPELENEGRCNF
ncbi:MAG: ABC transporter substrate-binding protein [Deltaproteobacteria bacterium]|nr:ABC transporter substrate-binding protein [Deltaproteobacteria bacterium]